MEILLIKLGRESFKRGSATGRRYRERSWKIYIGVAQQNFGSVYTDLLINNLHHVVDDVSHPLLQLLPFS